LNLVREHHMPLARLVELLTSGPMKVLGKKYGGLKVGEAADLALIDLEQEWTYRASEGHSKSRNTPFEGWKLQGKVLATWVDGKLVHE